MLQFDIRRNIPLYYSVLFRPFTANTNPKKEKRMKKTRNLKELLVAFCVERGLIEETQEAAALAGRQLTRQEINDLIEFHLKAPQLFLAQQAAAMPESGRHLNQREYERLIATCVKKGDAHMAKDAASYAGRTLTTSEVDQLVAVQLKDNRYVPAFQTALCGASPWAWHKVAAAAAKSGRFQHAQNAAQRAGRDLTRREINQMVRYWLDTRDASPFTIDAAIEAARLGASPSVVNQVVKAALKQKWFGGAVRAASVGVTAKAIRQLITTLTKRGYAELALEVTGGAAKQLSQQNCDELIKGCIRCEEWQDAKHIASLNASSAAKEKLIAACVKKGRIQDAKDAAALAKRSLTSRECSQLLAACAAEGDIQSVRKAAALAGRDLTDRELKALTDAIRKYHS